eukprot:scaffold88194_cov17-Tisochrysis_lutea.AAC.4
MTSIITAGDGARVVMAQRGLSSWNTDYNLQLGAPNCEHSQIQNGGAAICNSAGLLGAKVKVYMLGNSQHEFMEGPPVSANTGIESYRSRP